MLDEAVRTDLPAFVLSAVALLAVVGVGEVLRVRTRLSAEATRRVVHVGVGLCAAAIPYVFYAPDLAYVLAAVFVLVNLLAHRRGWLRGMHATTRKSWGTVAFPLAVLPALALTWGVDASRAFAFPVAFLILAFADPAASVVGMANRPPHPARDAGTSKSAAGSAAFFAVACAASAGALLGFGWADAIHWSSLQTVAAVLVTAVVTTAVEAVSKRGWDNLFVVLAAVVVLVAMNERAEAFRALSVAVVAGVAFGLMAYRLHVLNRDGAIAGGLFGATLIGLGGWPWAVPAFTFFVLSSMLSRVGRARKRESERLAEKGSRRDAAQVLANGGVGWGLLVLVATTTAGAVPALSGWYWAYVGAFAAATADTWATEVGTLAPGRPRLITTGKRVPRGTSGAVSGLGTLAGVAGTVVVWIGAVAALGAGGAEVPVALSAVAVTAGGVGGALVDSLLGATRQARFRDPETGQETERASSSYGQHERVRGVRWLRNDQVNWACTATGAALAAACFQLGNFAS